LGFYSWHIVAFYLIRELPSCHSVISHVGCVPPMGELLYGPELPDQVGFEATLWSLWRAGAEAVTASDAGAKKPPGVAS